MREEHRVKASGFSPVRRPIPRVGVFAALKEAAVHEDARAIGFDEIGGSRDLAARGAMGSNLHERNPSEDGRGILLSRRERKQAVVDRRAKSATVRQ